VSVIDLDPASTTYNTVTATIGVGDDPEGVAVNPAGTRAYVTNYNDGTVSVINLVG
jgi:DNA-binding beta-propeller fold protein YncE